MQLALSQTAPQVTLVVGHLLSQRSGVRLSSCVTHAPILAFPRKRGKGLVVDSPKRGKGLVVDSAQAGEGANAWLSTKCFDLFGDQLSFSVILSQAFGARVKRYGSIFSITDLCGNPCNLWAMQLQSICGHLRNLRFQ